jgi:hypothetical protein
LVFSRRRGSLRTYAFQNPFNIEVNDHSSHAFTSLITILGTLLPESLDIYGYFYLKYVVISLCNCSTSVAIDVESKALVEPEKEKNATIVEVRSPSFKNEAKLHRGSALKQVSTCFFLK